MTFVDSYDVAVNLGLVPNPTLVIPSSRLIVPCAGTGFNDCNDNQIGRRLLSSLTLTPLEVEECRDKTNDLLRNKGNQGRYNPNPNQGPDDTLGGDMGEAGVKRMFLEAGVRVKFLGLEDKVVDPRNVLRVRSAQVYGDCETEIGTLIEIKTRTIRLWAPQPYWNCRVQEKPCVMRALEIVKSRNLAYVFTFAAPDWPGGARVWVVGWLSFADFRGLALRSLDGKDPTADSGRASLRDHDRLSGVTHIIQEWYGTEGANRTRSMVRLFDLIKRGVV